MFTVGAIIDRPQTTAKKRATNGRPYKQISAEISFSLPICVIMGLTESLPLSRGLPPVFAFAPLARVTVKFLLAKMNIRGKDHACFFDTRLSVFTVFIITRKKQ